MSDAKKIADMTDEELCSNLITCDYRGKEFKQKVLEELLDRQYFEGFNDGVGSEQSNQ